MKEIVLGSHVKLKNPVSEFERNAQFEVTNINENTKRYLITELNSKLPIAPTELVGFNHVELIK